VTTCTVCELHAESTFKIEGTIEFYALVEEAFPNDATAVAHDLARFPYAANRTCNWHWAVRVGDIIVDWTARQFDPNAPFPALWIDRLHGCQCENDTQQHDKTCPAVRTRKGTHSTTAGRP